MKVRSHSRMRGVSWFARRSCGLWTLTDGRRWVTTTWHFGSASAKAELTEHSNEALQFIDHGMAEVERRKFEKILGCDLKVVPLPKVDVSPGASPSEIQQPGNGGSNDSQ